MTSTGKNTSVLKLEHTLNIEIYAKESMWQWRKEKLLTNKFMANNLNNKRSNHNNSKNKLDNNCCYKLNNRMKFFQVQ
jgi:hypothetical protein